MDRDTIAVHQDADSQVSKLIRRNAEPFWGELGEYDSLMRLIGDNRFVLIGEASHGTHEFYKTRIELTKRLIAEKKFNVIAIEGDWPDAWRINRYVKGQGNDKDALEALSSFERFPTWLWRNADVLAFVEWLKSYNDTINDYDQKVGFYGLDLYSLYRSASAVVDYLQTYSPSAAQRAKERYACLSAFGTNEQAYGYAASLGLTRSCEEKIVAELAELRRKQTEFLQHDGRVASDEYFFAEQNAQLIATAQTYYREMFRGQLNTWNLRDSHMFETLISLDTYMSNNDQNMKAVVWAHNSHLGDARATQMSVRGELNLGQLIRQRYKTESTLIGFSTYSGTVTAASHWGGTANRMNVRPALIGSYEHLLRKIDLPSFILNLEFPQLRSALHHQRLERAIGVLYLPETERLSHYFFARLPDQFDALIHFQETQALEPIERTAHWIAGEDRVEETID